MAALAAARVPLRAGLTFTEIWNPTAGEEYECLTQVTRVSADGVDVSLSCNEPRNPGVRKRRLCWSDLRDGRMLHTGFKKVSSIPASGENLPLTIVGATGFSLSAGQYAELKRTGSFAHRYVQLKYQSLDTLELETSGTLTLVGEMTAEVLVNDGPLALPVLRVSGEAERVSAGRAATIQVSALILDDPNFPVLLDYMHSPEGQTDGWEFRVQFVKISLPSDDTDVRDGGEVHAGPGSGHSDPSANVEERLAVDKRLVVYGIYFDFASDRIRTESEPILKEIADALGSNPTWRVNIEGHTDNVGGDAYNLALSRRRSDAVRRALAERYGIAAERLSTAGYGASVPKDTNDTPEGRAKNRRVELVRLDGAELEAAPGRAVPESTLATSVHQRATQGMPTMQSGTCSPR